MAREPTVNVSVIIAARNAQATIAVAIRSALDQTMSDLEVIVVDDGSNDGTARVVEEIARHDARVVLLSHAENAGVSAARNTAITTARGNWLAVLDADDAFAPNRLELLLDAAERRGLDGVIDNLMRIDARDGRPIGPAFPAAWMQSEEPIPPAFLLERDFPHRQEMGFGYSQPVVRTSVFHAFVGRYDTSLICAEDTLALQQMLSRGARIGVVDHATYIYNIDPASSSHRPGVNRHVSCANRAITRFASLHSPDIVALAHDRQAAIDYDGLRKAALARRWGEALFFARSMSATGLARQAWRLGLKRIGVRSNIPNPLTGKPDRVRVGVTP